MPTRLTALDLHLFNEGTHGRLYDKLGAHPAVVDEGAGCFFGVWAPNATQVSVIGDFNSWDTKRHPLRPRDSSGIWEGFLPGIGVGAMYKYHVVSRHHGYHVDKADPFAFSAQTPPRTASVVTDLAYAWGDSAWMQDRARKNALTAPISIYEVHLGSWWRERGEGRPFPTYRELAPMLAGYVKRMGFTHVEFLPVMEHLFYGSWGYQTTGYFAPTSRYGSPQDFMYLIDQLHQEGIGVILDWVPSHFPTDEHGLCYFDGTHLFEHADPKEGFHPDWTSAIFNYGRNEVRSFLLSSALFWMDEYHADGLRVDGVASMLYRDYSRRQGEWIPNKRGGRENLEAVAFVRQLNEAVYGAHLDVQVIAEESTSWPMVSRPTVAGGLGFGLKWDMGWMHDTLIYLSKDPVYRKHHQNDITFRMLYAFDENFILPLSHDEVVHHKGSLLAKMPGIAAQKVAQLRLLLGYMYGQPGKKLLFMGGEFGAWKEWNHDEGLDWDLATQPLHLGVQKWVADLNRLYRAEGALHDCDFGPSGFEWVACDDSNQSVIAFLRKGGSPSREILVICNFTPVPRTHYRIGVSQGGAWRELLNSDAREYGGIGMGNLGKVETEAERCHGRAHSVRLTLPPLSTLFFCLES